ncbi:MFS transporter [Pseudooceanicola sp. LIPI14-2-Ac024]|uniref:MFS transporter n=1 Tax=Pseudooceanicola sp. LIPI14-2-Ac024 TaxID=3344875 RepID=UPI0035D08F42
MTAHFPQETTPRLTANRVLAGASLGHFTNDLLQSLLLASYPVFRGGFDLSFAQLGLMTFCYQITASLLQPVVGAVTDRRPMPFALPMAMVVSFSGLVVLAFAGSYAALLVGCVMLGCGSSIFHPEAARVARLASQGSFGMAQSYFQLGGNAGSAVGPLVVAAVILPHGQQAIAWFAPVAAAGVILLAAIARWAHGRPAPASRRRAGAAPVAPVHVKRGIAILLALMFSKFFYMASFSSYYVFYLAHRFGMGEGEAQMGLFVFLAAVALGTILGGKLSDRLGTRAVIAISFWGALPFALALPYAGLWLTMGLAVTVGFLMASAFPAIVVHAQALMPGRVGMVSGLFFGLAFGMGGLGAALLGVAADHVGIETVYAVCAFLPLFGLLIPLLPTSPE